MVGAGGAGRREHKHSRAPAFGNVTRPPWVVGATSGLCLPEDSGETWGMTRYVVAVLVASFVVSLGGIGAEADASVAAGPPVPQGDPRGVALLGRVVNAYRSVPGVAVTVAALSARAGLVLRSGIVVAEESRLAGLGDTETTLVRREGGPTYTRLPGQSCWRRSDPGLSIDGVGDPFPVSGPITVQRPRQISGGWSLRTTSKDNGTTTITTYRINSPSYLLRSVVFQAPNGKSVVGRIRNLSSPPHVDTPQPRC